MSMLNNLHYIQNNGEKAFLANQNKKYACPECNKPRTVHYDYCIYCKQENKIEASQPPPHPQENQKILIPGS